MSRSPRRVMLGTRFAAATESDAHPDYVAALVDATAADTELTTAFSVMWPDAPHRVLRSSIQAARAHDGETVGEVTVGPGAVPVPRLSPLMATRGFRGAARAPALYAGHSVDGVRGARGGGPTRPAASRAVSRQWTTW